ncbi:MAG: OmpA family protein [Rikenellaceae bacterium]
MLTTQVYAQTKEKEDVIIERVALWDNWFVGAGFGTTLFLGDHDHYGSFGGRLAPALDLSLGKWFAPGVGARLRYSGPQLKGYTNNSGNLYVTDSESKGFYNQKWSYKSLNVDAMLNVSDYICGYKEDRFFSFVPYAGAGWMHTTKDGNDAISLNAGVYNSFKVASRLDLFLDVRATIIGEDAFDKEDSGDFRMDGLFTATVGVTYRFGKKGWKKPTPQSTIDEYVSTINTKNEDLEKVESELTASKEENVQLKEQVAELNTKVMESKVEESKVKEPISIFIFKINSAQLSNLAKLNLKNFADFVNARSRDEKYKVVGYSDKQTGTVKYNNELSQKRAQSAYDFLVNECGVDSSKLTVEGKGGVDNMFFDDAELNRAVIIERY